METVALTTAELATRIGAELIGPPDVQIRSCGTLQHATGDQVSFVSNQKYTRDLATTHAGAVIVSLATTPESIRRPAESPLALLRAADPYYAFRQAVVLLHGFRRQEPQGISPLAQVDPAAKVAPSASIDAYAIVGPGVVIGENSVVHACVRIFRDCVIGNDCIIYPSCTLYEGCRMGDRVILHSGTVIGSDGYGFATHGGAHHKIPQVGNVVLEDDVEVGANSVIERAVLESTIVASGSKLGNGVVIGHNCRVGNHNLLVSQVGIAGSTVTGKYVVMGGQVGVAGHLHLGDQVTVAAKSGIIHDVPAKQTMGGSPAMEIRHARKVYLQFTQLPDIAARLRELEEQVSALRQQAMGSPPVAPPEIQQ